ncbi:DUF4276 family protein [Bilophila wadsworthia]|uniref:DUF4276 family protein n=1 Tax=Bilophila wadsworthia TaxID=35833 RepID=UPI0024330778|nr:DUF4276 family protein [Bilophila wadsworthia]
MIRLHITAEGQTEQRFTKSVLAPHLCPLQVIVDARCVLTSKDNRLSKEYRGGLISYVKAKQDILNWLKEDDHPECRFTTMFDLYALPNDFPGYAEAQAQRDAYQKVEILETRLKEDIGDERFIPYIQLHEFEALILADPQQLDWEYLEHDEAIAHLISMVGDENPELINNSPETAPSKRILKEIPEYDKATAGPAVTEKIGIPKLRERCRHFHEWLSTLEQLNGATHE